MLGILDGLDSWVVCQGRDGRMTCLVVLDHVDSSLQGLLVYSRWEGGRIFKAEENSDIEELVFGDAELCQEITLGGEGE